MNRLAAILLLFLSEEDAFWGLVAIIESIMPQQYYDRTLIAAHADQVCSSRIFAIFLKKNSFVRNSFCRRGMLFCIEQRGVLE